MVTQKSKTLTIVGLMLLALVMVIMPFQNGYSQPSTQSSRPQDMELLGGAAGLDMIASTAVADILTKKHPGIRISPVKTMDIDSHFQLAEERDPNKVIYALNNNSYIANVLPGVAEKVYAKARWIAAWNTGVFGFATTDPKIKSLADCAGKTLAMLPGPIIGTNQVIVESLKELGIYNKVTIKRLGFTEQYNALQDGLVDVVVFAAFGGVITKVFPQTGLVELLKTKKDKVYLVGWPHKTLKQVFSRVGFSRPLIMVPAGALPLQTEPVEATGIVTPALGCQADANEQLIYGITKILAENASKFAEYHPSFVGVTPENMVKLMPLYSEEEVHTGAVKYYKETGIWAKAWEKRFWIGPQVLK